MQIPVNPRKSSVRFYVALSTTVEGLGEPNVLAVGHRATAESSTPLQGPLLQTSATH